MFSTFGNLKNTYYYTLVIWKEKVMENTLVTCDEIIFGGGLGNGLFISFGVKSGIYLKFDSTV